MQTFQDMQDILKKQQEYFYTGATKDYKFRIEMLKKLEKVIKDNEEEFVKALSTDLKREDAESYIVEIHTTLEEVRFYIKKLKKMMKPKRMKHRMTTFSSTGYITKEPKGTTLIISPWNYPFYLSLIPLINNIGAGNTAILNMSERSPITSKLIENKLNEAFDSKYIFALDSLEKNYEAISLDLDHIFFTGSTTVGKLIMKTASETLTPVTLELGGKSPAIITDNANIKKAVKTILWGKLINSGQTCIAPDHIYVKSNMFDEVLQEFKTQIENFDYEKRGYIDQAQHDQIERLLENNEVVLEKEFNGSTFYITNGQKGNLATTEVFGMILPLIKYETLDEVFPQIKFPLAAYIFEKNKKQQKHIIDNIVCRGFTINGTVTHISNNSLPFGGIKTSGLGGYHGFAGFDELTYTKSVLKSGWFVPFFIFPPYKYSFVKKILEFTRIF